MMKTVAGCHVLGALACLISVLTLSAEDVAADGSGAGSAQSLRIVAHRGAMSERPECTLSAFTRAVDLGADVVEVDVRLSRDGVLFVLHDATLDRTTSGSGPAADRTMAELKRLDAGSWFGQEWHQERIPTLAEVLEACRGRVDVLLDLKEQGAEYAAAVSECVHRHGAATETIVGVRSAEQALRFRRLLPQTRQLAFAGTADEIGAFLDAGVDIVRVWPRWLYSQGGPDLVDRIRRAGADLQINARNGTLTEILPLLRHRPDLLLVDDVAALRRTLHEVSRNQDTIARLSAGLTVTSSDPVGYWVSEPGAVTFLNRDYRMLELPDFLQGRPRIIFPGGLGHRIQVRFRRPAVVFAAFEYNSTGNWSFPDRLAPEHFGWAPVAARGYRGTSNATVDGRPHYASVYRRTFAEGEILKEMPPWWLCLGIVDADAAAGIPEATRQPTPVSKGAVAEPFLYGRWAARPRPLQVPEYENPRQWAAWQQSARTVFRRRLVFPFSDTPVVTAAGPPAERGTYSRQEFHVACGGRRLFRFFRLQPTAVDRNGPGRMPTIVCFMGHGKVSQILDEPDSYQHACAARFAQHGYLVFAMENVGMEPMVDRHLELDRVLRLDGYGWYSLLFAHQLILLDHVFSDPQVAGDRVGTTGVSTGGLLALSAIALDPRVRAASIQGIFGSMRVSFIRDRQRHCSCGAIPGLLPEFDLPELALLASPRPLHISNATDDGFGPEEARRCLDLIAPLYAKTGGPEPVFTVPEGRHEYHFESARSFFEQVIGAPEP